jgi:hypothetical protein
MKSAIRAGWVAVAVLGLQKEAAVGGFIQVGIDDPLEPDGLASIRRGKAFSLDGTDGDESGIRLKPRREDR